jgi:hypothetical protein
MLEAAGDHRAVSALKASCAVSSWKRFEDPTKIAWLGRKSGCRQSGFLTKDMQSRLGSKIFRLAHKTDNGQEGFQPVIIRRSVSSLAYEMADQRGSESVIAFGPTARSAASNDGDQLDAAGQTILKLLHKAAGVAEANSRHALDMAQKLSHQLRAAEDRIAEQEAEIAIYRRPRVVCGFLIRTWLPHQDKDWPWCCSNSARSEGEPQCPVITSIR